MSRDHYKGTPKKRDVLINADNEVEVLQAKGIKSTKIIHGSVTLSGISSTRAQYILQDARISTASYGLVASQNNALLNVSSKTSAGELTISGSATGLVAYQVYI